MTALRPLQNNSYIRLTDNQLDTVFEGIGNRLDAEETFTTYVRDNFTVNVPWRLAVVVACDTDQSLTTPGATLDGVSMVALDRVLMFNQTDPKENGVYVWTSASATMDRAPDADAGRQSSPAGIR